MRTTVFSLHPRIVAVAAMGCAWLMVASAAWGQAIDLPADVKLRTETGQLQELAHLLQSENPNYARLTFSDDELRKDAFREGWDSWYSGKRHYIYARQETDRRGYLYLDGHCSWVVRDLETMTDRSRSSMDQLNYGAIPAFHEDKFYMVGGYGFFRFHRNWYKWDPRGGFAIGRHDNDQRDSLGYRPPNILHAFWRDSTTQSFFALGNAKMLDEPTGPAPDDLEPREEFVQKKLRQFQIWRFPDRGPGDVNIQLLHFRDVDDRVFGEAIPIGSVETRSWVIFILDDGRTTPALHKETMEWYGLDSDRSLPFGPKQGLYGWMVNGDSLAVINNGTVYKDIDLNAHMDSFRADEPEAFAANSNFLLAPYQPSEGISWWVWTLMIVGSLALGTVIWFQRRDQQRVEVKLNKISNQVEVLEAFSQRIFHSIEAEDILWGIAAQSVESLGLDQCSVYTRSDVSQSWECRAVAQADKPIEREAHEVTGFALDEGIIGRAGMRGAVEVDKPAQPLPMHDGKGLKASVMAIPIVCDGKVIGVVEAALRDARDIDPGPRKILSNVANLVGQKLGRSLSERKTMEFARFYEDNPSPVMRLSAEGLVLLTNDSARAHFGASAIVGETLQWHELVLGAQQAYEGGTATSMSASHKNRIYQLKVVPNLEFGFVNVYAFEVTELEQAKSRAQKAERAKADFLSVMSHEIRTPLNAILGLNEVMLLDNPDAEQQRQLKYIRYSGQQLLTLVNDILNLEALHANDASLEAKSFNLHALLTQLLDGFDAKAQERNNTLQFEWHADLPHHLSGNRHWVSQMVSNLVDNALKFTSRGEVSVRVMPGIAPEMIFIEVEDNGTGIAEEHLVRITDPFEQILTGPKNTGEKGTGLGLAITKRLATLHGGKLLVQSTEGVGSKFTLSLVLTPGKDIPAPKATAPEKGEGEEAEVLRVLVVDDNPLNLMVAQKLVERLGHQVTTAIHGEDAVAQWKKDAPDVILMDLQMPVMDGMEATRIIRTQSEVQGLAHQRIVALTADAEKSTRQEALSAGMDDVVVKPVDAVTLHRALHALPLV